MSRKIVEVIQIISLTIVCCFASVGSLRADNAANFENYLANLVLTGELVDPIGELGMIQLFFGLLDEQTLHDDLLQLQPSWYADFDWSIENSLTNATREIGANAFIRAEEYKNTSICLREGRYVCFKNFWIAGSASYLKQRSVQQLPAFHSTDLSILAGFDYVLSDHLILGVAAGYVNTELKWNNFRGSNTLSWDHSGSSNPIDSFYVGPYMAINWCGWMLEASLLKGFHRFQSNRHIHFAFVDRKERNTHYGDSIAAHLGGKVNYCWGICNFEPYILTDYVYVHVNSIKERTKFLNSLNLAVSKHNTHFFQGEIGAIFSDTYQLFNATFVPKFKIGFQTIAPLTGTKLTAHLVDQPGSFTVQTNKDPVNQAVAGLLLNFYVRDWPQFILSFDGAWGNERMAYCYMTEFLWDF